MTKTEKYSIVCGFIIFTSLLLYFYIIPLEFASTENPDRGYDYGEAHNCRLWGAISDSFPDSLIYNQLVVFPRSLKNLSSLINTDGWGIADFAVYGGAADIARGKVRAFNDTLYDNRVSYLESVNPKIILAHVRNCESGCCCHDCDSIPDPHPFTMTKNGKTWVFVHNGSVSKDVLYDLIGETYLLNNPPSGSGIPECDPADSSMIVDSELFFIFIMKSIEEHGWNVSQGLISAVISIMAGQSGATMNFILSDGYGIWGFRRGWSLFYIFDQSAGYSAVASYHPEVEIGSWQGVPDFRLLEINAGITPVITDIRDHFPEGFYIPGDANGNLDFNGLDVTYSVSFLKGTGSAPPDTVDCPGHGLLAAAADANGSCSYNGLDVTYCVNYLKGHGNPPASCADCPPNTVLN